MLIANIPFQHNLFIFKSRPTKLNYCFGRALKLLFLKDPLTLTNCSNMQAYKSTSANNISSLEQRTVQLKILLRLPTCH